MESFRGIGFYLCLSNHHKNAHSRFFLAHTPFQHTILWFRRPLITIYFFHSFKLCLDFGQQWVRGLVQITHMVLLPAGPANLLPSFAEVLFGNLNSLIVKVKVVFFFKYDFL